MHLEDLAPENATRVNNVIHHKNKSMIKNIATQKICNRKFGSVPTNLASQLITCARFSPVLASITYASITIAVVTK